MLFIVFPNKLSSDSNDCTMIAMQNKHPSLAMYNSDMNTESMSFTDFEELCDPNKECEMLNLLTELGLLPISQRLLFRNKYAPFEASQNVVLDMHQTSKREKL